MAIFYRKPFAVEAKQWHKHGDHHAVFKACAATWELLPEEHHATHGLLGRSCQVVHPSDWIVTAPGEDVRVYSDRVFRDLFYPQHLCKA